MLKHIFFKLIQYLTIINCTIDFYVFNKQEKKYIITFFR